MRPIFLLAFAAIPVAGAAQTPDTALAAVDQWIRARAEADSFSGAVLVAKNGVPLLRRGYGLANRETRQAATPETRFNLGSIDKLIDALMELRSIPLPSDPLLGNTHYTVGLISGGVAPNVVSPSAEAEVMFRSVSDAAILRRAISPLERKVTIRISAHKLGEPYQEVGVGLKLRRWSRRTRHDHSRRIATSYEPIRRKAGDTEFETPIESSRKTRISSTGGAESGATLQDYFDPNIAAVVQLGRTCR